MTAVALICTGRDTHPPVTIAVYETPLPPGWTAAPRSSVLDLYCDRAAGGCGRSPRLSTENLRALIEQVADAPEHVFDLSMTSL
jgi:hypothetical protein